MWDYYTNDGSLVLTGTQAKLFRIAARALSDEVGWEESVGPWEDEGLAAFDSLTQAQKQIAIMMVAGAALEPAVPMPDLTAVLEGTVTMIYATFTSLIEDEIETGKSTELRAIVSDALIEIGYWEEIKEGYEEDEGKPLVPLPVESKDLDEWQFLVEALSYELVDGDCDFYREKDIVDAPPDQAAMMYEYFGIHTDYFTAIVNDPPASDLPEIRKALHAYLAEP